MLFRGAGLSLGQENREKEWGFSPGADDVTQPLQRSSHAPPARAVSLPPTRQQARTDTTRRKLLLAAEKIFARDGFEAARLEDIAALAGYTRGAFYANFQSKEDIFFALLERWFAQRIAEVNALIARQETPAKLLRALRDDYVQKTKDRRFSLLSLEFKLFSLRHPEAHARLRARQRPPGCRARTCFAASPASPAARFPFPTSPPPSDSARSRMPCRSSIRRSFHGPRTGHARSARRVLRRYAWYRFRANERLRNLRLQLGALLSCGFTFCGKVFLDGRPRDPTSTGTTAFTYPSYRLFQTARFFIVLATEMQSVAIGWQVYEITRNKLDLGLVGLWQFLPGILLFLVSGHTADRYDRRKILTIGYAGFAVCSGLLLTISLRTSIPFTDLWRGGDDRHRPLFNAPAAAPSCR